MDEIELELLVKPFSINNYYYKTRQRTRQARLWANEVFRQLHFYRDSILAFRESFLPPNHVLNIELVFSYPRDVFFNKSQIISSKTMDLSNVEKPIIDLITHPRYNLRVMPEGCNNLNLDDKFITKLISYKIPSDDYKINIIIKKHNIKDLLDN